MSSKMTPKLPSHGGMSKGGKEAPYLCDNYEVAHQDEPTPSNPINAHKQMAGHMHPGKLEQYKG